MQFPKGNKHFNPEAPLDVEFGDNMKLLEERLAGTNWRRIGRFYAIGLATLLVSLFLLIVTIRLALHIF
jgi:hypothetical protein